MVGDKIDAQCLFMCSSQAAEQDIFVPKLASQKKRILLLNTVSTGSFYLEIEIIHLNNLCVYNIYYKYVHSLS